MRVAPIFRSSAFGNCRCDAIATAKWDYYLCDEDCTNRFCHERRDVGGELGKKIKREEEKGKRAAGQPARDRVSERQSAKRDGDRRPVGTTRTGGCVSRRTSADARRQV